MCNMHIEEDCTRRGWVKACCPWDTLLKSYMKEDRISTSLKVVLYWLFDLRRGYIWLVQLQVIVKMTKANGFAFLYIYLF